MNEPQTRMVLDAPPASIDRELRVAVNGVVRVRRHARERHALQGVAFAAVGSQRLGQADVALLTQVAPDVREGQIPFRPRCRKVRPHVIAKLLLAQRQCIESRTISTRQSIEDGTRERLG